MLKTLLSAAVAVAFLLCGTTVAMEALGLIFQTGPADAERRVEAGVAPIEASLDPWDVPGEAEAEGLWPPPEERAKKPGQAVGDHDEGSASAVAVGSAWTVRVVAETEPGTGPETGLETGPEIGPEIGPETGPETEPAALDPVPPAPKPMAAAGRAAETGAPTPELGPPRGAKACTGPCNAKPSGPKRARPPRTNVNFNCPLSGWFVGG